MKDFKAKKKNIKDYKNKNAYLDAVYRNNKKLIDSVIPSGKGYGKSSRSLFKKWVKEVADDNKVNIKKALRIVARKRAFTPKEEQASINFYKELRKNKETLTELRRMSAWNKKIKDTAFVYKGSDGKYYYYQYGNILIRKKKSPEDDAEGFTLSTVEEN